MALIGWSQGPSTETEKNSPLRNGESAEATTQELPLEAEEVSVTDVNASSKKRKAPEIPDDSSSHGDIKMKKPVLLEDDGDDLVIVEQWDPDMTKKKRLV